MCLWGDFGELSGIGTYGCAAWAHPSLDSIYGAIAAKITLISIKGVT